LPHGNFQQQGATTLNFSHAATNEKIGSGEFFIVRFRPTKSIAAPQLKAIWLAEFMTDFALQTATLHSPNEK